MKDKLLDFLKGFLIGLDTTIPGFSIGTLAISLNIYERLIDDLSNILKHPIKIIIKDLFLGLGFIIGLICNILLITFLLKKVPLETVSFFVGIVIMTIPKIYKDLKLSSNKISFKEIITLVISLIIMGVVTFLNKGNSKVISLDILFLLMILLMGIISAGTMIIPGISGSLIIMAFGYYDVVLDTIKGLMDSIVNLDFSNFKTLIIVFIIFAIGAVFGLVFVSKLIKILLDKKPNYVYSSILGLLLFSPISIYYLTINSSSIDFTNPIHYIVSIVLLALGIIFGKYVNKK